MINNPLAKLAPSVRQYLLITTNYWAFTLTDGALRMLVVLHFHNLGYSPLEVAMLFLFYEIFGVITNLTGGWLGAKVGLNRTMNLGLALQLVALGMLLVPADMLSVAWVMVAQAFSGVAKDLNKMSAKSAIKLLLPPDAEGALYRWVALLTGSKNAMKGFGFFLGGALLSFFGFKTAIWIMLLWLTVIWIMSLYGLRQELGKTKAKPKFRDLLSKSNAINLLSAARMCLFAARDVWFVVAVPVYLSTVLEWSFWQVGGFLAAWVIGYGFIQGIAPQITGLKTGSAANTAGQLPDGKVALVWASILTAITLTLSLALSHGEHIQTILIVGLLVFGAAFAVNSAVHSYLIISYADADGVSLDVGFYYMANALGRLLGTVLSGWVYQVYGLTACLWVATGLLILTCIISIKLPRLTQLMSTTNH